MSPSQFIILLFALFLSKFANADVETNCICDATTKLSLCRAQCEDVHRYCIWTCDCPLSRQGSCHDKTQDLSVTKCSVETCHQRLLLSQDPSVCIANCGVIRHRCRESCLGNADYEILTDPTPTPTPLPKCSAIAAKLSESIVPALTLGRRTSCTLPIYCRAVLQPIIENGRVVVSAGYRVQAGADGKAGRQKVDNFSKKSAGNISEADGNSFATRLLTKAEELLDEFGCAVDLDEVGKAVQNGANALSNPSVCAYTDDPKCAQLKNVGTCSVECE